MSKVVLVITMVALLGKIGYMVWMVARADAKTQRSPEAQAIREFWEREFGEDEDDQ